MRDRYDLYPCKYYHYFSDYSIHECYHPDESVKKSLNFTCKDPKKCPYRNDELKLVRCPFCHTEQDKSSYKKNSMGHYIECKHCHVKTPEFRLKVDAVKFWNRSRSAV